MYQLNLELLEQYEVLCKWVTETNLPIPNSEKLRSLLNKTHVLLKELYCSNSPKTLQYLKLADEKKQNYRTDDKEPEPMLRIFKSVR